MKSRQCSARNYRINHVLFGALSKPNPNFSKSGQAKPWKAKWKQRKRADFPWIPLSGLNLFKGLRRPPPTKNLSLPPTSPPACRDRRASSGDRARLALILIFVKIKSKDMRGTGFSGIPQGSNERPRLGEAALGLPTHACPASEPKRAWRERMTVIVNSASAITANDTPLVAVPSA
jgi:hypothetical protein